MEKYLMDMCKLVNKYAKEKVDKVYICCTRCKESYNSNVFFEINNKVILKKELDSLLNLKPKNNFFKFGLSEDKENKLLNDLKSIFIKLVEENPEISILKIEYDLNNKKIKHKIIKKEIVESVEEFYLYYDWYNEIKEKVEKNKADKNLKVENKVHRITSSKMKEIKEELLKMNYLKICEIDGNKATSFNYIYKEIYAKAKAIILLSNFEGLPFVCLEALSCGCPIILLDSFTTAKFLVNSSHNFLSIYVPFLSIYYVPTSRLIISSKVANKMDRVSHGA